MIKRSLAIAESNALPSVFDGVFSILNRLINLEEAVVEVAELTYHTAR